MHIPNANFQHLPGIGVRGDIDPGDDAPAELHVIGSNARVHDVHDAARAAFAAREAAVEIAVHLIDPIEVPEQVAGPVIALFEK